MSAWIRALQQARDASNILYRRRYNRAIDIASECRAINRTDALAYVGAMQTVNIIAEDARWTGWFLAIAVGVAGIEFPPAFIAAGGIVVLTSLLTRKYDQIDAILARAYINTLDPLLPPLPPPRVWEN